MVAALERCLPKESHSHLRLAANVLKARAQQFQTRHEGLRQDQTNLNLSPKMLGTVRWLTILLLVGAHRNADVQAAIRAVVALYVALYNERVTSHPRDPLKSNHLHTLFWDSLRSRNTKQVHIGNTR